MSQLCDNPDYYDRIIQKTLDKFIPFKVDWEVTYRCNLKCAHCYQNGPSLKRELTTAEIYSVLDQLANLGSLYITFTGGEILLRKDFFEIAEYARKKEFAIRLFTNGTLIDEKVADKIKALNPLSVEISLYGMDSRVHENITKIPGSYEKTINAFRLLKERNIHTVVKCTAMKENVAELDKLKDFAKKFGFRFVFSLTLIPKIDTSTSLSINPEHRRRVDGSKEILKFRLSTDELKYLYYSKDWLMEGVTKGGVHSYEPLCSAGINSIYISPYGEVFPCVVLREDCGNLRNSSLKEIWQSAFFKKLRQIEFKDLKPCSSCDLAYYCDRCAGLALLENKDLFGPSVNDCTQAAVRKWALERKGGDDEQSKKQKVLQEAKDSL